ncbi:MAG TPA: M20/M25/M40 family metallo-hydrolase [Polyangia bacterium]|jgi:acetylornithine deacetylase/succinyl-diaminopimelate desuccinylase-like protein
MDPDVLEQVADEAVGHLQALVRLDTTNPPGAERAAAEYLAGVLRAAGLEPAVLEAAPGRGNLVARLRGDGSAPPLLLAGHLDVVPADAAEWRHPPFGGEVHDGWLYGRGAVDMKGFVAQALAAVLALRRTGARLRRDVIFAAVADEEYGCELGSAFLVREHPALVRAEYALGEVGGFSQHLGPATVYPIMVAEKGLCWLRARWRGPSGHGSMPRDDSAVLALCAALARLKTRLPLHVTPVMRRFLAAVAATQPLPARAVLPLLAQPALAGVILDRVLPDRALARSLGALLANTASPTVLRAGDQTNVIPPAAEAEIDGRLLPGQTAADLCAELARVLGPEVELTVLRSHEAAEFSTETPLYRLLADAIRRHDPGAVAVPALIPGFTDASQWRRLGTICYGFAPVRFPREAGVTFAELFHGRDERIPVAGFRWGVGVLLDVVHRFCG